MKPKLADYLRPEDIDDMIEPVCQLADMDTSKECGCHSDPQMDALIRAARDIRDREGFLSVDGEEIPGITIERS